jgi:hypothetical protein
VHLSNKYAVPLPIVVGITASLSPAIKWDTNIDALEKLLLECVTIAGYTRNVEKAKSIYYGDYGTTYESVLSAFDSYTARKTRSFYINLYNPLDPTIVTVDRWMMRAAYPNILDSSAKKIPARIYSEIEKHIIGLARRYNMLPNQMQAIIWLTIRDSAQKKQQPAYR